MEIRNGIKEYSHLIKTALVGIPIGIIVGIIDTVFAKGLSFVTAVRLSHPNALIPFLGLAGVMIILIRRKLKKINENGINLIFAVGLGEENKIPLRLVPFVMFSAWITHLFGGSAGREGVALQIGATISNRLGRKIPIKNGSDIFLVTGLAAGFAGLFLTPIAAVLFAVEVLVVGEIKYKAFLPAFVASFSASLTSRFLGLEKMMLGIDFHPVFNVANTLKITALGIIFGVAGIMFVFAVRKLKFYTEKYFPSPLIRIFIIGIFISVIMILFKGRYCGVGANLIDEVFRGDFINSYDWILKLLLTALTLTVGFMGGEIMPLFSIGALLGSVISSVIGMPSDFVAALGFAAVFGSATNTFFAPVMIGCEIFGYSMFPYFFAVSAIAYFCNFNRSVYTLQKTK